jgi:hypothetical protein
MQQFIPHWHHDDREHLELLSDWVIEHDGQQLVVSKPSRPPGERARVTLGVAAVDLPRARKLIGRRAELFSRTHGRIGALTVKAVDPDLSLLTASFEPDA